jgi:hypothetical protein
MSQGLPDRVARGGRGARDSAEAGDAPRQAPGAPVPPPVVRDEGGPVLVLDGPAPPDCYAGDRRRAGERLEGGVPGA